MYCIVLYCIVLYCIVLYCIALYFIVFYCIELYCIALYCIVLMYCIVLYCIVLYCIFRYCNAGSIKTSIFQFSSNRKYIIAQFPVSLRRYDSESLSGSSGSDSEVTFDTKPGISLVLMMTQHAC